MTATTITEFARFLTPDGQQQLVAWVQRARDERGAAWLDEIQDEFPTLAWITDLVANYTADESLTQLAAEYGQGVRLFASQIKTLHAKLREEIDKKR